MGAADSKLMMNRRDDDEKRLKSDYYNRSKDNRDEYDGGLKTSRSMKEGMDTNKSGAAGSYCGMSPRGAGGSG